MIFNGKFASFDIYKSTNKNWDLLSFSPFMTAQAGNKYRGPFIPHPDFYTPAQYNLYLRDPDD